MQICGDKHTIALIKTMYMLHKESLARRGYNRGEISSAVISGRDQCRSAAVTHAIRDPNLFERRDKTGVDEPHAALSRFVYSQSVIGILLVAVMVIRVHSVLFC